MANFKPNRSGCCGCGFAGAPPKTGRGHHSENAAPPIRRGLGLIELNFSGPCPYVGVALRRRGISATRRGPRATAAAVNAPVRENAGWAQDRTAHTKRASQHPQSREQRTAVSLVSGDPKLTFPCTTHKEPKRAQMHAPRADVPCSISARIMRRVVLGELRGAKRRPTHRAARPPPPRQHPWRRPRVSSSPPSSWPPLRPPLRPPPPMEAPTAEAPTEEEQEEGHEEEQEEGRPRSRSARPPRRT